MPHRIDFDFEKMNEEFEDMMDEVYLMYHNHPTYIPHLPITDAERLEISANNHIPNLLGGHHASTAPHKVVVFHRSH